MNLPMPVAVALMLAVGAVALWAMWRGWRGLARRSAPRVGALPTLPDAAALGQARTAPIEGTYVSTTGAGDWLDRLGAGDLGFRARAIVQVFDGGVQIARAGSTDLFLPTDTLEGARLTAGMAGKYVGGKGIVVLRWTVSAADGSPTLLDTGIRTLHAADRSTLIDAVTALVATSPTLPPDSHNPKESE